MYIYIYNLCTLFSPVQMAAIDVKSSHSDQEPRICSFSAQHRNNYTMYNCFDIMNDDLINAIDILGIAQNSEGF